MFSIKPSIKYLLSHNFVTHQLCLQQSESEADRISAIVSNILSIVKTICATCDLGASDVARRELTLICNSDPISVTFRALLVGQPQENELIINNIQKWVEDDGEIDIGQFTVKVNSNCDIVITSLDDELCTVQATPPTSTTPTTSTTPPTTEPSPPVTSKPSSNRGPDNTASIVVPIVVIIIIAVVGIVILAVVILLFRRRQQQKSDPYLNFDEQETTGTARLSQNLYEQSEGQREYGNPIYGEGQGEETKTDLEREYLENPSILK